MISTSVKWSVSCTYVQCSWNCNRTAVALQSYNHFKPPANAVIARILAPSQSSPCMPGQLDTVDWNERARPVNVSLHGASLFSTSLRRIHNRVVLEFEQSRRGGRGEMVEDGGMLGWHWWEIWNDSKLWGDIVDPRDHPSYLEWHLHDVAGSRSVLTVHPGCYTRRWRESKDEVGAGSERHGPTKIEEILWERISMPPRLKVASLGEHFFRRTLF